MSARIRSLDHIRTDLFNAKSKSLSLPQIGFVSLNCPQHALLWLTALYCVKKSPKEFNMSYHIRSLDHIRTDMFNAKSKSLSLPQIGFVSLKCPQHALLWLTGLYCVKGKSIHSLLCFRPYTIFRSYTH